MIEHKFFYLDEYKKDISRAAMELDKLMLYEGFIVLCSVGKKNNVLLLRRVLEDAQPIQQTPTTTNKNTKRSNNVRKSRIKVNLQFNINQ